MLSLWFVVPAYGRLSLSAICLRQLRRTCDALTEEGIEASAVVIADDENLDTARALGFGTIERDNRFVSRKFNDGIQLACDPAFNSRPADYVVPYGSDDWVDYRLFVELPVASTVIGFQRMAFVREDGREVTTHFLDYPGGAGIRIYPREVMRRMGYRPADEDRKRACDTSMLTNVCKALPDVRVEHRHFHDFQIVDWKSSEQQLNPHSMVATRYRPLERFDSLEVLRGYYPDEALDEMSALYSRELVAA